MAFTPSGAESAAVVARARTRPGLVSTIVVLFKLRVVSLLLFAAFGGAMIGSAGAPALGDLIVLLLTGTMSAAGASAINQYLERYKDSAMKRTSRRPLVTGEVNAALVLTIAIGLIAASLGIALAVGNPALAFFLGLGAFIYVGIYTIWLKPRSVLNVVIGGAAGSAAVLSGGAAVHQWTDPGVLILSLLLFTWSPTHFWSLALAYRADYQRAGVPMLPVVVSPGQAIFWMLAHMAATAIFGLLLAAHSAMGVVYLIPVLLITLWLARESIRLIHEYTGKQAMNVFKVSNIYLSVVLLAICVAALV
ncbi:MAG TPA: heme o synthase [Aggregatilineaceae bacterium]|nr:heme o synthase [Aggregatilineaceae bacterium]